MSSRNFVLGLVAAIGIVIVVILALSGAFKGSNKQNQTPAQPNQPPNTVIIQNYSYNPSTLTVKKGTTVTWTNNNQTDENVISNNNAFTSSGTLANGQSYRFTFQNSGNFPYHSSFHPYETGTIVVE